MNLSGMRITVMGLGVHGGGLAAARYAVSRGATVTVTDLRSYDLLKNSADELPGQCRVVLGRHERDDFVRADMVIKNPAVPRTAPLLADAAAVTSDIALFLAERETLSAGDRSGVSPLIAVTGTKGKSTCSSLAAHIVAGAYPETMLGGNITVSPLSFLDTLKPADPVVLELSSFQLGDLAFFRSHNARSGARIPHTLPRTVFFPAISAAVAIITNIFTDHQDYYPSMEAYVEDKREIYRHLPPDALVILPKDNQWTPSFIEELSTHFPDNPVYLAGPVGDHGSNAGSTWDPPFDISAIPAEGSPIPLPGRHNKINIAMAAAAAARLGVTPPTIAGRIASFPGVPHRLQTVGNVNRIRFINDTAATIPEAAREGVNAFDPESSGVTLFLIAGGSDKGLDPRPLVETIQRVLNAGGSVALLDGTATDIIGRKLSDAAVSRIPRFSTLTDAVHHLYGEANMLKDKGDEGESIILLSPGCASFGMFRNEFDRGNQFIEIATAIIERDTR